MRRNSKVALGLGLILILVFATVYLAYENSILSSRLSELEQRAQELNKRLFSLKQQYEVAQYQLQYYRSLSEKQLNLNLTGIQPTAAGLLGRSSINLVSVREIPLSPFEVSYEGVVMAADIEIRIGEGRLLINTQPKIGIDLQASAQTAETVVQSITGVDFKNLDVILTIKAEQEVEVVDGPSAGAAITIGMIAAIQNKTTNPDVFISGTVNPDGTIGQVGGLPYKALAAAKKGAKLFLLPAGESNFTVLVPKEQTPLPGLTIVSYEQSQINIEKFLTQQGYRVQVEEVTTIIQAYNQFTG